MILLCSDIGVKRCINCNAPAPYTWFCPECTAVKEAAYAESKRRDERFSEVISRRDAALQQQKERRA